MKRSIGELSNDQVQGLLLLHCGLSEDGRSTKASAAARRQQLEVALSKMRADLGLNEAEASELSVVLESNRRSQWMTLATAAQRAAMTAVTSPAGAPT